MSKQSPKCTTTFTIRDHRSAFEDEPPCEDAYETEAYHTDDGEYVESSWAVDVNSLAEFRDVIQSLDGRVTIKDNPESEWQSGPTITVE